MSIAWISVGFILLSGCFEYNNMIFQSEKFEGAAKYQISIFVENMNTMEVSGDIRVFKNQRDFSQEAERIALAIIGLFGELNLHDKSIGAKTRNQKPVFPGLKPGFPQVDLDLRNPLFSLAWNTGFAPIGQRKTPLETIYCENDRKAQFLREFPSISSVFQLFI